MKHLFKSATFWAILATDILLLVAAHLLAYAIRFEGGLANPDLIPWPLVLPWLIIFKILIFHWFGLYRGMWRYTGLTDLASIVKACLTASLLAMGGILIVNRFQEFSRSIFILDGLLTFLFISGHRVALRLYFQGAHQFLRRPPRLAAGRRKRLLVIGAGDAAEKLLREVRDNLALPYEVIGLLDDAPGKLGKRIHGSTVIGVIADLPEVAAETTAQEILIAIPSAASAQMARIVGICQASGLPFKTLPNLAELINHEVSIKAMREVSYRDLLGRPPVDLKIEQIDAVLTGRCVLVTGAGGSIGSELCRQILRFKPARLILLDAAEMNLYGIEMEILHEHTFVNYVTVLGKVQDQALLDHVFDHFKPTVVFHAAAYKHVPMVERNPWEAVVNNVLATRGLIDTSVRHEVERFILVSTDKAVRPTNVMGASKRLTEKIMQAYGGHNTRFMAVRFGNVLGSSGSVIPLFRRQIELGGPVTVTHPEMTRYFMSIEEAAQLILQAAAMGTGGEIFVLEMGSPVKIVQMARDLIRLCGKEPDTEIEITFVGLRPGEKLYEELITVGEGIVPTDHEKIMVLRAPAAAMQDLEEPLTRLTRLARDHDGQGIKALLQEMVPEYTPQAAAAIFPAARVRQTVAPKGLS